jgi:HEPN domain-containing protein
MNGGADPRSDPGIWLEKAAGDLASAQALLQASVPSWTAAFHAQQCVEKCVKALLVALHRRFPKSHDIRGLVHLLPDDLGLVIDRRIAAELSESAITGRYPGTEDPDVALARALVGEAQRVFDWTRVYLEARPRP